MIEIKGVTKSFGSLQVLKGIDLRIEKGEIVSIVGPSGAGKTTLLQILGTLDKPDSGSVVVDGIETSTLSTYKTKRVSQHASWLCVPVSPAFTRVYGNREYYDSPPILQE